LRKSYKIALGVICLAIVFIGAIGMWILLSGDVVRSAQDRSTNPTTGNQPGSEVSIAIYSTDSAGCAIIYDLLVSKYRVKYIYTADILEGNLSQYDVAVFPGGSTHFLAAIKSVQFRTEIIKYVERGGRYLGICGGAILASFLHLGDCDTGWLLDLAIYHLYYTITDTKGVMAVRWQEGNIFEMNGISEMTWAAGPYFTRLGNLKAEAVYLHDQFLLLSAGKPAIASGRHGEGKLVLFGMHPEYPCPYPDGDIDNGWMILRAVEWLLNQ